MKKTVIFDLDGTLLYTLEDLADSTNFALEKYNHSKCTLSQIRSYVGNGVARLVERAIPSGKENPDFQNCLETMKSHYKENMYNKTRPFDGVLEMLDTLQKKHIRTAVVSNKFDSAVKELCGHYFGNRIEIAIGESLNVKKKPAPDSVLEVMRILNTPADECVYVGDSEVDILTAKNAGIKCISVDWGYKDRSFLAENGAKNIVSSCDELLAQILE